MSYVLDILLCVFMFAVHLIQQLVSEHVGGARAERILCVSGLLAVFLREELER